MLIQKSDKLTLDITQCNLRSRILFYMEQKGWKQKDLEEATGVHKSTLSKLLKGERQINLEQIDAITDALGLSKGELYHDFVSECVDENGKFKVAKSEEFIISCYQANLPQLAKAITDELLNQDIKNNKDIVLRISDKLYENKMYDYALSLYDEIIKEEQKKSSKLAVCYFRKFMILRDQDLQGKGREALFRLLDYLPILPDEYTQVNGQKYNVKLDAYYRVLTFFNVMEEWDNLLSYAQELEVIAKSLNDQKYLGEALLYQGFAYKGKGDFISVFNVINRYSMINDYYKHLSVGSRLFTKIEMGDIESIPLYLKWCSDDKDICTLIPIAVEAYYKNGLLSEGVNFIRHYIPYIEQLSKKTFIPDVKRYMRFKHAEALLYIETSNMIDGLKAAIKTIELAKNLGNINRLTSCMSLIYKNYQFMNDELKEELQMVLERR